MFLYHALTCSINGLRKKSRKQQYEYAAQTLFAAII